MPRRCPTCQQLVDDDRLVACPGCHASLANFPQVPAVGEEQEDRIVNEVIDRLSKSGPMLDKLVKPIGLRIVKSVHWWIAFPLFWVAVLVGSHFTIKGALESLMISRIDQEFREPRIQATMQKVINDKASEMLTNEIQPAVDRFRADLQNEYQALSEEIEAIKLQSNLPLLSNRAIFQGDREAFEEIVRIARAAPEDSPLKNSALDLYKTVLTGLTNQYYGDPVLTITLEDGTVRRDWEISTARLMTSLSDADWKVRARAAALLSRRSEKGVPDRLLHVARTDKNLKVVSNALISFGHIAKGIARPRVAGEAPISQTEFIELLNINKLDQWWQEHSPEVNERLADMN